MNATLIIWPMVLLALVTLGIYIPMSRARVASVKSGEVKVQPISSMKVNLRKVSFSIMPFAISTNLPPCFMPFVWRLM